MATGSTGAAEAADAAGSTGGAGDTAAGPGAGAAPVSSPASNSHAADHAGGQKVRVDSWIWSVRLTKSRSQAADACRGGHVKVNNESVKPSHLLRVGDEVRVRDGGFERVVVVKRLISKRVGPPVAAECYVDNSPPKPPREAMYEVGLRDRGAGRPTKRDRRDLDRLFGRH